MNGITQQIRALITAHDAKIESLQKEYHKELSHLQAQCAHTKTTRWAYQVNGYGEVAATADGVLIKSRECLLCGLIEYEEDRTVETLEIPF